MTLISLIQVKYRFLSFVVLCFDDYVKQHAIRSIVVDKCLQVQLMLLSVVLCYSNFIDLEQVRLSFSSSEQRFVVLYDFLEAEIDNTDSN